MARLTPTPAKTYSQALIETLRMHTSPRCNSPHDALPKMLQEADLGKVGNPLERLTRAQVALDGLVKALPEDMDAELAAQIHKAVTSTRLARKSYFQAVVKPAIATFVAEARVKQD